MRACEGCRRRKIKCDAATTNSWPCAACIRLKLNCVPPTVNYDKDFNSGTQTFELDTKAVEYPPPSVDQPHDYHQAPTVITHGLPPQMTTPITPVSSYADGMRMYQTAPYMDHQQPEHMQYPSMPQQQIMGQNIPYTPQQMYSEAPAQAPQVT
jgi:hypothetical protein